MRHLNSSSTSSLLPHSPRAAKRRRLWLSYGPACALLVAGVSAGCGDSDGGDDLGSGGTSPGIGGTDGVGAASSGGMVAAGGLIASGGQVASGGADAGGAGGSSQTGGGGAVPTVGGSEGLGGSPDSGGSPGAGGSDQIGESDAFEISAQLASDVDPAAPTTVGIVTWSLPDETVTDAHIEFGMDDTYGMDAPVDLSEEGLRTLLLGMKPASTYHFRIVATTEAGTFASVDQTIETGAATSLISMGNFEVLDDAAREQGFIVTSYWRGDSGSSIIFILDTDGDVVWWYDTGMNGVSRARMSADGKNMWMVEPNNQGATVQRVSIDTLDGETYGATIGSHDITPVSGSTMAYLDYGESDCDSIFEIEPDGTTTEVFESQDIAGSGCHGNALRYSKTEDSYTMSDVSTDVWVITRAGEFQWGLADIVSGGVATWGGRNHGHHLLEESFLLFANDGASSSESAAIEYDLAGNEVFRYESGEYSANLGDVQRLPGGNTLVTYSNSGIIHEVTPDGTAVLKITTTGQSFGYALWRESLYGSPSELDL